jgi:putative ABC transport system substrate-binding protein
VRRRQFIGGLAVAAALPFAVSAQQQERVRRIGVFMPGVADNSEFQDRIAAFRQGLGEFGWTVGRNVRIDYRWGAGNIERYHSFAEELVALGPDVILGNGTATVNGLRRATRTVPIVFANIIDPVGSGLVMTLGRPGGNATGFIAGEFGFSGKWLELLKEVAPGVTRAVVIRDSAIASQIELLGGTQSVAPSLGVELRAVDLSDADDVERVVAGFGREPNGGVIVFTGGRAVLHREFLVALVARHRLAAVYGIRSFVTGGGLMSCGAERSRCTGARPATSIASSRARSPRTCPVLAPKYELVINLKTAKMLHLPVPQTLLARADEVIE